MLKGYLNKPIGELERAMASVVLVMLMLLSLLGDIAYVFNIDGCYEGLLPDLSDWYVDQCEKSTPTYKGIFGTIAIASVAITFAMLAVFFVRSFRIGYLVALTALSVRLAELVVYSFYYFEIDGIQDFFELMKSKLLVIGVMLALFYLIAFTVRLRHVAT